MYDGIVSNGYGERIKKIRRYHRLTQSKFGENIGKQKSIISLLESESRELKPDIAQLVCTIYNVNDEWLWYGTGDMFIEASPEATATTNFTTLIENSSTTKKQFTMATLSLIRELPDESLKLIAKTFSNITTKDKDD